MSSEKTNFSFLTREDAMSLGPFRVESVPVLFEERQRIAVGLH